MRLEDSFLERLSERDRRGSEITPGTLDGHFWVLYQFPGEALRETRNLRLDRDLILLVASTKGMEAPETDAPERRQADLESPKLLLTLDEVNRNHILAALQHTSGVVDGPKGAARILNLHPNTLRHRMDKLGIKGSRHRPS